VPRSGWAAGSARAGVRDGPAGSGCPGACGEGDDDRGRLHEAPARPELRVHHFLAAAGISHQQAQELAVPLDDTHLCHQRFEAGTAAPGRAAARMVRPSLGPQQRDYREPSRRFPAPFLPGRHTEEACPVEPDLTIVGAGLRTQCTGPIDLPGTTWRDRPAISRGNTLAVATDQSAAPGLLAEVAITAAQLAVQQLGDAGHPHMLDMRGDREAPRPRALRPRARSQRRSGRLSESAAVPPGAQPAVADVVVPGSGSCDG
jgi:hypothetical protein